MYLWQNEDRRVRHARESVSEREREKDMWWCARTGMKPKYARLMCEIYAFSAKRYTNSSDVCAKKMSLCHVKAHFFLLDHHLVFNLYSYASNNMLKFDYCMFCCHLRISTLKQLRWHLCVSHRLSMHYENSFGEIDANKFAFQDVNSAKELRVNWSKKAHIFHNHNEKGVIRF